MYSILQYMIFLCWVNQNTGEVLITFSVITTAANELMSEIDNEKKRMHFVLAPAERDKWLGRLYKPGVVDMMKPLPDGYLEG